jgi:aryl-alcohol dehydrogenase-like predicted oxidoreductase
VAQSAAIKDTELILRYTISHPHCHTTIVGTSSPDHLAENAAAVRKGPLPVALQHEVRHNVAKAVESWS